MQNCTRTRGGNEVRAGLVEVDLRETERGCKCQHTRKLPRNSPRVALSKNDRHVPLRENARRDVYAYPSRNAWRDPTTKTGPPVALTGLHVSWTQRAAHALQAAPSAKAFWGTRTITCVLSVDGHSLAFAVLEF